MKDDWRPASFGKGGIRKGQRSFKDGKGGYYHYDYGLKKFVDGRAGARELDERLMYLEESKSINSDLLLNEIWLSRTYRLVIELVPQSCWYINLRNNLGRDKWDIIRYNVYRLAGYRCMVCKASGWLNCHETWDYDDVYYIQKLKGFSALCDACHGIKHIGLSKIRAGDGELDYRKLIKHFMVVNDCSYADFKAHEWMSWAVWDERNCYEWSIDYGQYRESLSVH